MGSKLENIKAIEKMIAGNHRTQTASNIGWTNAEKLNESTQKREIGEIWNEYDSEGNIKTVWEQKNGYRVKTTPQEKQIRKVRTLINEYPNCLEDCNTAAEDRTRLDIRYRDKFGRCADCQLRMESMLKVNGDWQEYERQQIQKNAKSFFKNSDLEIQEIANVIKKSTEYVNENGKIESWSGDPEIADKIIEEYEEHKQMVIEQISNL